MDHVIANFDRDWTEILRAELRRDGCRVAPDETADEISIKYFKFLRRRVPQRPRTVHVASSFACPVGLKGAWAELRGKVERGDDLTPHLSRRLRKDFDDRLLNDWGVHHFHLGSILEADGFAKRTGPLLYARVTIDELFSIAVREHGRWSDRDLIEVIHANWPDSIRQYRLGDVGVVEAPDLTSDEVGKLRAAGVSMPIQMQDGTVYFPPGGGYATDRTSMQAVAMSDRWRDQVQALEQHLRDHIERVVATFKEAGQPITPPYEFQLNVSGGRFRAVEKRTKCAVSLPIGPAPGW